MRIGEGMMGKLPARSFEADEAIIVSKMRNWPERMVDRLQSSGLGDFSEAGCRLWRDKFERELLNPNAGPDTLATIIWLADTGHPSAAAALRNHATRLLEDPKADLPASLRAFLVRQLNGLLPSHPENRSDVLRNMVRDIAIWAMVDAAAARWSVTSRQVEIFRTPRLTIA